MAEPGESLFKMLMEKKPGNFSEQIVYEDKHCVAFLDKFPMVAGHTLVVPRKQVEKIHLIDDETAGALGSALAKVAKKVCKATGTEEYNVIVNNGKDAGQEVPHVHYHIVPRKAGDFGQSWMKSIEGTRDAKTNAKPNMLPDDGWSEELIKLRDNIREQ